MGLCDLPIATSGLCDKSEEVCVRSCTRKRVLRVDCEFPNYDFVITRGEDREDKGSMPEVSLLDLTKLIQVLSSSIQAVLQACLQFRFLQQKQILSLKQTV